jgi:FlaA1/EpsC-like NDP-sugar epimerase
MYLKFITIKILSLPRSVKKLIVIFVDLCLCIIATWLAFCLRYDQIQFVTAALLWAVFLSLIISLTIFINLGLYRSILRYSGWFATIHIIKAFSFYTIIYALVVLILRIDGLPRSIGIIQPILFFVLVGISRLFAVYTLKNITKQNFKFRETGIALIYGAGVAGRQLASGLRQGTEITPFAFIDDDRKLWNHTVNGLPVFSPHAINNILDSGHGITDIFVAIPSSGPKRQMEILNFISQHPVRVRILPGLNDLAYGELTLQNLREVQIEDVLYRDLVLPDDKLLNQNIAGKVVMVTGAGGSIGAELCRQILLCNPKSLILYELSEFALYNIEREISKNRNSNSVVPVLGSVLDDVKLSRIMSSYGVQTVYHAAAYKHVPLIEANPSAGVLNNIFGTLYAVDAALKSSVETFVLISTDKAVRPTSIMGCTKRFAELILQAKVFSQNTEATTTKLTMVRFGNVLGSSGSVVPLFREQIKNGGPITVTHPEVTRYFMTIPEAAQLVIQAGAMGKGGDVMVLDMGEPVKIYDLAIRMINLSGCTYKSESNPEGDIEINFTGLRPGEKLYEELLIGNNTSETNHPKILRAEEKHLSWNELDMLLSELKHAVREDDTNLLISIINKAIPEYLENDIDK